jgi:hypothetical protein
MNKLINNNKKIIIEDIKSKECKNIIKINDNDIESLNLSNFDYIELLNTNDVRCIEIKTNTYNNDNNEVTIKEDLMIGNKSILIDTINGRYEHIYVNNIPDGNLGFSIISNNTTKSVSNGNKCNGLKIISNTNEDNSFVINGNTFHINDVIIMINGILITSLSVKVAVNMLIESIDRRFVLIRQDTPSTIQSLSSPLSSSYTCDKSSNIIDTTSNNIDINITNNLNIQNENSINILNLLDKEKYNQDWNNIKNKYITRSTKRKISNLNYETDNLSSNKYKETGYQNAIKNIKSRTRKFKFIE